MARKPSATDARPTTPPHTTVDRRHVSLASRPRVSVLNKFGQRVRLAQVIISTAVVYFKRFYLKRTFRAANPYLVALTAIFLACKVEESTARLRDLLKHMQSALRKREQLAWVQKITCETVLECELHLLEAMNFDMIVFHPYRQLQLYLMDAGGGLEEECLQTAWSIVNDSYRLDLCLYYPPYMIALAATQMACTYHKHDPTRWLDKLTVDQRELDEIAKQILALYRQFADPERVVMLKAALKKLDDVAPKEVGE